MKLLAKVSSFPSFFYCILIRYNENEIGNGKNNRRGNSSVWYFQLLPSNCDASSSARNKCQIDAALIKLRRTRKVQLSPEVYAGRSAGNG